MWNKCRVPLQMESRAFIADAKLSPSRSEMREVVGSEPGRNASLGVTS